MSQRQIQRNKQQVSSTSFSNLSKLDLSYNGLKKIDSQAFNAFNNTLETLMLQNNEINSYNLKFLQQLTALKDLDLGFNLITSLQSSSLLFRHSANLQFLSMQGNSIQFSELTKDGKERESPFEGLSRLQRLNLARNGIKYLPADLFKPMSQLKSLILDKNVVENLNEFTFDGLFASLMNISLQNAKINAESVQCLRHFERLERVKLGFNEIERLDWTSLFAKTSRTIANLDLQHNRIHTVEFEETTTTTTNSGVPLLTVMESLQELDLSNNELCSVNANLVNRAPKLKNLGLAQNPLYCDCHLLPLYEWTQRRFDADMRSFIQWQCEVQSPSTRPEEIVDSLASHGGDFEFLNSNPDNSHKYRKFTSLSAEDFVCNSTRPSRCTKETRYIIKIELHSQVKIQKKRRKTHFLSLITSLTGPHALNINKFVRKLPKNILLIKLQIKLGILFSTKLVPR